MNETNPSGAGRRNPPAIRRFLIAAGVLVLIASIQLYVLTEQTDQYFAWTIQPPITAAFLGASYLSSLVLVLACAHATWWRQARAGVLSVGVFTTTTTIVTLLHLDPFHFDAADLSAQVAAWAWLVVYLVAPVVLLLLLIPILRNRVSEPLIQPLPTWLRRAFLGYGSVVALIAVLMLVAPTRIDGVWPWTLSELTARTIAAWLLALGVLIIHSAVENDLDRIRRTAITAFAFTPLQVIAIVRYLGDFDAGSVGGVGYILALALVFLFGVAVLWLSRGRIHLYRDRDRFAVLRD